MPTENRSRNTELAVQHPQGRRERFQKWVLSTKHPVLGYLDGTWLARGDDREGYADKYVQGLWVAFKQFDQPAPQPHPEPIAWMVGTAFWWTKEEAERDAAATGLPMIPVGPTVDTAEVERLREENAELVALVEQQGLLLSETAIALRGPEPPKTRYSHADIPSRVKAAVQHIAERDALLRDFLEVATGGFSDSDHVLRVRRHLETFLSASAEPEAT
ncbi:hypothetical protein [Pseudomonas sp. NBRC 111133]|uniref:hypothetical protein n=1 Tax=Pseudomonas sp. NBRC 111133 TaxID=1661048 RepID=UPI000760EF4A|nr:hypothetical protein [Pseudomonas sp. NBRC 111133]